jgi:EPS-associated MarR family transcriptional regulator
MPIATQHCGSVPKRHPSSTTIALRTQPQKDLIYPVMPLLQPNPDLTQREIAQQLGICTGGLNYCLKALIAKGLVKIGNFSQSKNRFGYMYVLIPQSSATKVALTGRFLQRKLAEYQALQAEQKLTFF